MPRPRGSGGRSSYDKYRRFSRRAVVGKRSNGKFMKLNHRKKSRFDK